MFSTSQFLACKGCAETDFTMLVKMKTNSSKCLSAQCMQTLDANRQQQTFAHQEDKKPTMSMH